MKINYKIRQIISFTLLFFLFHSSSGQNNTILDSFTAIEIDGTVFLKWIISSGSTCNGINIFRSDDTVGFMQIGRIDGICGDPGSPQPYDFIDEHPLKNKVNYYRLELGTKGYSEIISIEIIDLEKNNYQVRPNPVSDQARIYFDLDENESYILTVYNIQGCMVDNRMVSHSSLEVFRSREHQTTQ